MKRVLTALCIFLWHYGLALRDPFRCASGKHSYVCAGIGTIHGKNERFAILFVDGQGFLVRQHDIVAGQAIQNLLDTALVLKDEQGQEQIIGLKVKALQLTKS